MAEPEVSAETSSAETEAEPEARDTSPTNTELILPPLVCLSLIGGGTSFLMTSSRSQFTRYINMVVEVGAGVGVGGDHQLWCILKLILV